jgi:hypothetical protein
MAHLIEGVTKCAICDRIIERDAFLSPPFLPKEHRLWRYSDAAFHRQCVLDWAEHDLFEGLLDRYLSIRKQMPKNLTQYDEVDDYLTKAQADFDRYALSHQ